MATFTCLKCSKISDSELLQEGNGVFCVCEHCKAKIEFIQANSVPGALTQFVPFRLVESA